MAARKSSTSAQRVKMGWIEKKSKYLGIYRTRWTEVFHNDKLCSFKHESDNSPSEIIDLSSIYKAYQSNLVQHEFILAFLEDDSIKTRRFRTSSSDEAKEWVEFFNQSNLIHADHTDDSSNSLDQLIIFKSEIYNECTEYQSLSQSLNSIQSFSKSVSLETIIEE